MNESLQFVWAEVTLWIHRALVFPKLSGNESEFSSAFKDKNWHAKKIRQESSSIWQQTHRVLTI